MKRMMSTALALVLLIVSVTVALAAAPATPVEDTISKEDAIQIAKETILKEYPISAESLDRFTVDAIYHVPDWRIGGLSAGEAVWNIEFILEREESEDHRFHVYMVEMKKGGSVLGHISNDNGVASYQIDQWTIEKGPFFGWSWEDQASYSKLLAQLVVDDRLAGIEPDGYALAISKIGFGIPGPEDMEEQQAIQIAVDYVKSFYGATDKGLGVLKPYTSFDMSNPEAPVWRVKLLAWMIVDWTDYESIGYVVHVNANTGEVIHSRNRNLDDVKASDLL